jgi:flavin reductase (DIM6/NTAB) family NADH-FMN oxidoreductase RutF
MNLTDFSPKIFELFNKHWALLTAGEGEQANPMTISWGSLGTIWGMPGKGKPIVTVYVHPDRYTYRVLNDSEFFTVSFFPEQYRRQLGIMGSISGRDGKKIAKSGLTAKTLLHGVAYEEAVATLVCRKIFQQDIGKENMLSELAEDWYGEDAAHRLYIGEIISFETKAGAEEL